MGGSVNGGVTILSNSVGKFGVEQFQCSCGENIDNHYHCSKCDKKYSDETNIAVEQRTKQCGCGLKFNC